MRFLIKIEVFIIAAACILETITGNKRGHLNLKTQYKFHIYLESLKS